MNLDRAKKREFKQRVRTVFRPYLRSAIKGLDQLVLLDSAIPPEIKEIQGTLAASGKWRYRRMLRQYARIVSEIDQHNASVKTILDRLDAIDVQRLYDEAGTLSDEEAKGLYDLTTEAYRFYVSSSNPYREKIESIRVYAHHIDEIRAQWDLWIPLKELNEEIQAAKDYIPRDAVTLLKDRESQAKAKTVDLSHPYYPFDSLSSVDTLVKEHNETILERYAADPLFDDISGICLDKQQRRAAVSPERTSLVIAGAGSGKTTTICGRVRYLLQRKGVRPEDILLLSYSRKSAEDLAKKMALIDDSLSVGTFHKIGLDILKSNEGKKMVVEEQWDAIIEEYFRDEMMKDPDTLRLILTYYGLFLNNGESKKRYQNEGELFADLKKEDFVTFKESLLAMTNDEFRMETIKKERVKSFEEMALANYYFINGVDYQYERVYEFDVSTPERRQYTPDFYLKKYGIYHEHFGIDADGRAKQFDGVAEMEYLYGISWKRECHQLNGTTLIETTSAEFTDGTVFERLEKELKAQGVEFHPISDDMVRKALSSVYAGQPFKSFINLIKSFLSLYKARYEDDSQFARLKETAFETKFGKMRADMFLSICEKVYHFYMDRIRAEGKIDFDDMILRSTRMLPSTVGFSFKHIIVDEFQDISYSRMMFLRKLIEHGNSSLFAVGDDWQSIYRFSGCDVNILLHFEEYFGESDRYFIGNVHRNSQQLQDIATKFIQKNPEQIRKEIHAEKSLESPIQVVFYRDTGISALDNALGEIANRQLDANVLLLGRNNKDINPFMTTRFYYDRAKAKFVSLDYPEMTIAYSTVHGSKGLEEDYVILLSAKDSRNGFPNKTEDDPLLDLVMSSPSKFPYAEERRLWYVAITRTRSYTYILVPAESPSDFIRDMIGGYVVLNPDDKPSAKGLISCPRCKGGHLVTREGRGELFYGCSNYPYCTYSIDDLQAAKRGKRCPECGDFMLIKRGQWGYFWGCHGYPRCKHTEKYEPKQ